MEKKSKKPIVIMIVTSVIILILGFICGIAVYAQITAQIASNSSEMIIDGTDVSGILGMAGNAGALVLSVLIVGASLAAVLLQWLVYGIVLLIKGVYAKNNNNTPTQNNNIYQ